VVFQVGVDRAGDRHGAARADEERVAVGQLVRDIFGGEPPAGSRPIFDHNRLAENIAELRRDETRENIVAAAGGNNRRSSGSDGLDSRSARAPAPSPRSAETNTASADKIIARARRLSLMGNLRSASGLTGRSCAADRNR